MPMRFERRQGTRVGTCHANACWVHVRAAAQIVQQRQEVEHSVKQERPLVALATPRPARGNGPGRGGVSGPRVGPAAGAQRARRAQSYLPVGRCTGLRCGCSCRCGWRCLRQPRCQRLTSPDQGLLVAGALVRLALTHRPAPVVPAVQSALPRGKRHGAWLTPEPHWRRLQAHPTPAPTLSRWLP